MFEDLGVAEKNLARKNLFFKGKIFRRQGDPRGLNLPRRVKRAAAERRRFPYIAVFT